MGRKKSLVILVIISLGIIIPFVAPYVTLNPENSRVTITSPTIQYPALAIHVFTAFIALITGFLQFNKRIRLKKPSWHRLLGRVYVACVLISGLLSFVVVIYIKVFTKIIAFFTLTILWLLTTWKGYRYAVNKKLEEHRVWMIRSFGLTLVAVCGRLLVPPLLLALYISSGYSLPEDLDKMIAEVLNVNIWVGIIVNVVIVEWFILKPTRNRVRGI